MRRAAAAEVFWKTTDPADGDAVAVPAYAGEAAAVVEGSAPSHWGHWD